METSLKLSESYSDRMARRRAVSSWLSYVTARDIAEVVQQSAGNQVCSLSHLHSRKHTTEYAVVLHVCYQQCICAVFEHD